MLFAVVLYFILYKLVLNAECVDDILNALSPNSNKNEISLYIITTCSNLQVTRIKEVITEDKMS